MTQQTVKDEPRVTVETYQPSQYSESVWPVVSNDTKPSEFIPAYFEQITDGVYEVDRLFADFGKRPSEVIELSQDAGDFELNNEIPDIQFSPESEMPLESVVGDDKVNQDPGTEFLHEVTEVPAASDVERNVDCAGTSGGYSEGDQQPADFLGSVEQERDSEDRIENTHGVVPEQHSPQVTEGLKTIEEEAHEEAPGDSLLSNNSSEVECIAESEMPSIDVDQIQQELYAKGYQDAQNDVKESQKQLEERYALLWEDMQVQLDEAIRIHERKSVELAFDIARKLVGTTVATSKEYLREVVQEAIKHTGGAEISQVRVSPHDYETLQLSEYGNRQKIIVGEHVSFVSDESIRAGCVLVTTAGEVDYDLDKGWERIRAKALKESES